MTYSVNLYTTKHALNEIYQQVSMGFALCRAEVKDDVTTVTQVHPFVLCRDFLSDALLANSLKKQSSIYGFSFDGAKEKITTNMTYLLVKVPNNTCDAFLNSIRVLHYYESIGRWRKTKIVDTGLKHQNKKIYLFVSTSKWVSSSQLISLYTLLIRCMWKGITEGETVKDFMSRISEVGDNDGTYLRTIKKIDELFNTDSIYTCIKYNKYLFKNTFNYKGNTMGYEFGAFHNNSGIKSFMDYIGVKKGSENFNFSGSLSASFLKNAYEEFSKRTKGAENG